MPTIKRRIKAKAFLDAVCFKKPPLWVRPITHELRFPRPEMLHKGGNPLGDVALPAEPGDAFVKNDRHGGLQPEGVFLFMEERMLAHDLK